MSGEEASEAQGIGATSWRCWCGCACARAPGLSSVLERVLGDKMMDGVIPAAACDRSFLWGRPAWWAWRQATCGSRSQDIWMTMGMARTVLIGLGGGPDQLLGSWEQLVDGGERFVAELAQDVVGAAAELARDRQAGALVVAALPNLQVVAVSG